MYITDNCFFVTTNFVTTKQQPTSSIFLIYLFLVHKISNQQLGRNELTEVSTIPPLTTFLRITQRASQIFFNAPSSPCSMTSSH
jgi:hypothetical protein